MRTIAAPTCPQKRRRKAARREQTAALASRPLQRPVRRSRRPRQARPLRVIQHKQCSAGEAAGSRFPIGSHRIPTIS